MPAPLTLHYHPFASFCMKALIALYEKDIPFERVIVDLGDPAQAAALRALWPPGKFPVLRDEAHDRTLPESSIIIEYLDTRFPGPAPLIPVDRDRALETRLHDRFFDLHLHEPMQRVVADRLRPAHEKDPRGVADAKASIHLAYSMIERRLRPQPWAMGEDFTLADCAAAPALHYAEMVAPLGGAYPLTGAYLGRLKARPSFARVLEEAQPFAHFFPQD